MELFPPLTCGLRLQLRDDAPLVDVALATHVLDLRQISHPGRAGERIWPTRAAPARALSALGPVPDSKPHPRDLTPLGKSGPPRSATCAPSRLLLSSRSLACRSQTANPTLGLVPLTESELQLQIQ